MAINVQDVVDYVVVAGASAPLVGLAVLFVHVVIRAFRWVRAATGDLGVGGGR